MKFTALKSLRLTCGRAYVDTEIHGGPFGLQLLTVPDANADDMLEFFDFSTPHLATPPSPPSQPTDGNCDAGAETANS